MGSESVPSDEGSPLLEPMIRSQPGVISSKALWISAIISSFPSFLFGYSLTALNTTLVKDSQGSLLKDLPLTTFQQELATSATILGAAIASFLAEKPASRFGLRKAILTNNVLYIAGALLGSIASFPALVIGRLFVGFGAGAASTTVPILLTEIAPESQRGAITSIHQLQVTIGILAAYLMGWGLVTNMEHGWRIVQVATALPCVLQFLMASAMFESPVWLARVGRKDEAATTLRKLRRVDGTSNVTLDTAIATELDMFEQEIENEMNMEKVNWRDVWGKDNKHGLFICMSLMFFSAATGINTIIFYSSTIFEFAGVKNASLASVIVGTVNFSVTVFAASLVDKLGRRVLLIGGTLLMTVSLILEGVVLLALNSDEKVQGVIAVMGVLTFVSGFALSIGTVAWVVMGEAVTARLRKQTFGVALLQNWIINLGISLGTLSVIK